MAPIVPDPAAQTAQPQVNDDSLWTVPPEVIPNVDALVIEDGKPVEYQFVEKLLRLLTEPLYSSWSGPGEGRTFKVLSNVGLFFTPRQPPLCPDVMLALDVDVNVDLSFRENRSYFLWVVGKVPDVVIEVVSDRRGGEDSDKMREYARAGIPYYVIFDPEEHLSGGMLRAYCLSGRSYGPINPAYFPEIGLGVTFWDGAYEGQQARWLRWCDRKGRVIPTGREGIEQERERSEQERKRAEQVRVT